MICILPQSTLFQAFAQQCSHSSLVISILSYQKSGLHNSGPLADTDNLTELKWQLMS